MRRLHPLRVAALIPLALAGAVAVAPTSSADAPVKQGWWSKWQQGPVPVVSLTLPPPPTGAPGGLTIARDATGETAVAALYFQVALGADATLYLAAAEATGVQLPPESVVLVCTATEPWDGQLNGAYADAPTWSDQCEPGTVVPGGAGITWTLSSTLQDDDGVYDLVVVPKGPAPYLVNFAATGENTLVPDEVPPTTTTTTEETTTTTTEAAPAVEVAPPLDRPSAVAGISSPTITLPPAGPATSLVAIGRPPRGRLPVSSIGIPDTRAERIMAVSLLFFIAFALWWLGGSPTRGPRLLGAAGGRTIATAPTMPLLRGVGRFARERLGRPPRL
jgi:hypothetical protein